MMTEQKKPAEGGKEIKLTLLVNTDETGRRYYSGQYDPEDLKDLCLVLLTDDSLKEVASLATAHIIARESDPEALLGHIREFAYEIRKELSDNTKKQ